MKSTCFHRSALSVIVTLAVVCLWFIPEESSAYLLNEWASLNTEEDQTANAEEPKQGRYWKEPVSGMHFSWVHGGCYSIGSPPRRAGRDTDEGPVRRVCVKGFWMGQHEVTQGEWWRIMRSNPSHFRKGVEYPVERVAWEDAEAFVRKLNSMYPGPVRFRLPTEAEWEYACRNGGDRIRFAGATEPGQVAWFRENSGQSSQPVGTRRPNRFGLFDMSGNVWEWTQNAYDPDAYVAKSSGSDEQRESGEVFRAIRGGSWASYRNHLRCSNRGFEQFSNKRPTIGLRLVRVYGAEPKQDRISPEELLLM
ncbi:MAG: formylglycine-generating enzyme family protein [Magnetococcales bacterium]|nr:formylglycine-generating enzyme family protein [Magnetococcales bacterium]